MLKEHGKTEKDVLWVGCPFFKTSWDNFADVANVEYDARSGAPEVAEDLIVMGDTFWLERHEYDGSEWWEYKSKDILDPNEFQTIDAITVDQANALGREVGCGWASLGEMNGFDRKYA